MLRAMRKESQPLTKAVSEMDKLGPSGVPALPQKGSIGQSAGPQDFLAAIADSPRLGAGWEGYPASCLPARCVQPRTSHPPTAPAGQTRQVLRTQA